MERKAESESFPYIDLSLVKYSEFMPTKIWLFMNKSGDPKLEGNGKNPHHPFAYMGGWPTNQKLEYLRADICKPQWQPIATAPRDRHILVYGDNKRRYVAKWVQDLTTGDEAFCVLELGGGERAIIHATHWQDLPEPPIGE